MNPLLQLMGGGNPAKSIMMQAIGAMMSGEKPEAFMRNLARTNPQLSGLDLNNLEHTAHTLSRQKGVDETKLTNQIKAQIGQI